MPLAKNVFSDDFEEREQLYAEPVYGLDLPTKPRSQSIDNVVITLTKKEFLERQDLFNNKGKVYFAMKLSVLAGEIEAKEDFQFIVDETDKSKNPITTFMKNWKELDITPVSLEKGIDQLVKAGQLGQYTRPMQMCLDLSSMV